ncbi:MAG TPA: putative DNA-binding domain-containing protein [Gammaproteobacteria bacterium]
MNASPDNAFRAFQAAFAARIRDPHAQPRPPGVPARRMRVYQELLFNNLEGFLLACFPITRKLLGARAWRRTVRRFFAEHRCASPLFRDIPAGFLAWMETRSAALFPERPYLYEFMHYEWLELAVSIDAADCAENIDAQGDILAEHPVLNPTARLARYRHPVHRIGPRYRCAAPADTEHVYLVYRDTADAVRFVLLNPVSMRLLELLRDTRLTGHAALLRIAQELHLDAQTAVAAGRALLEDLRRAGALSGTWRTP